MEPLRRQGGPLRCQEITFRPRVHSAQGTTFRPRVLHCLLCLVCLFLAYWFACTYLHICILAICILAYFHTCILGILGYLNTLALSTLSTILTLLVLIRLLTLWIQSTLLTFLICLKVLTNFTIYTTLLTPPLILLTVSTVVIHLTLPTL